LQTNEGSDMPEITETALKLLTREGAVSCHFEPGLTNEQFTDLDRAIQDCHTKVEMEAKRQRLENKWGIRARIDPGV
jgi:hypothetical protein